MPEQETEVNEAQMIVDRVKFELRGMINNSCIDYGRIFAILDGKL